MSVAIRLGGGVVPTERHAIAAGQTLVDGDFVTLGADATISEATAVSAALYGRFRPDWDTGYGIVELALPTVWFKVQADAAISAAMLGQRNALVVSAAGKHQADVGALGTTDIFTVRRIVDTVTRELFVQVTDGKSQAVDVEV